MRFYQTIGNFTFEFNDIPQFIAFTIGRLLALPIFIGLFILCGLKSINYRFMSRKRYVYLVESGEFRVERQFIQFRVHQLTLKTLKLGT